MSIGFLPTVIDPEAYKYYVEQFLCAWERPCLAAFDQLEAILMEHLLQLSRIHFARFDSSRFLEAVK